MAITKIEAYRADDGTVHATEEAARRHMFTKVINQQMKHEYGDPLTDGQIEVLWRIRFNIADLVLLNGEKEP